MRGSRGSPHSSHSLMVSGMSGSSMVVTQSTNGTSATTARQRRGAIENTAPCSRPPAESPRETIRSGAAQPRPDEHVGGGDEVGEGVALAVQSPVQPPGAAALTAAPDVRHRVHETPVQQAWRRHAELRPVACLISPVTVKQAWRRTVRAGTAAVSDRDGDLRAVRRGRGDALGDVPRRIVARHVLPFAQLPAAAGQIHVVPGRRVDERLRAHGHRRGGVVLVGRQGERDLRATGLDEPLLTGVAVQDAQLGRGAVPLLHHQVPPEHVGRYQARVRRPGDDLGPRGAAGRSRRRPHQPELCRLVVGDQVELPAVRPVGVIGTVFDACLSRFQDGCRCAGVGRRDDERLRGVPRRRLDQHVRPAAGGPHGQIETLVPLGEDQDVLVRRGTQLGAARPRAAGSGRRGRCRRTIVSRPPRPARSRCRRCGPPGRCR